jgi:hypothetical protein
MTNTHGTVRVSRQGDQSYHDAENLTLSKGSPGRLERIGGEIILYPSLNNSDTGSGTYYSDLVFNTGVWSCVGSIVTVVDGVEKLVEFWKDIGAAGLDSLIRVDGIIMAQNPYIGFGENLDLDENGDGIIFCTDGVLRPMFFDVRDLLSKSGTDYYYNTFDPKSNYIILSSPNNFPVFLGLITLGSELLDYQFTGTSVLKNGQYSYSVQYGTLLDEFSPWSHPTPLIPILQKNTPTSTKYTERGVYLGDPGEESSLGIKLVFRINNDSNYDFVRIKRTEYEGGIPVGYTPVSSVIIGTININPQQISTVIIADFGGDEGSISVEEDVGNTTTVDTAKALKYYNSRLWLFNTITPELSLNENIIKKYSDNSAIKPCLKGVGSDGFANVLNHVYGAGYMSGEKYGFAYIGFDSSVVKSFALQANDDDSGFLFPNRRKPMNSIEELVSDLDKPIAARMDGTIGKCFERYDNQFDIAIGAEVLDLVDGDDKHTLHPVAIDDIENDDGRTISGVYTTQDELTNQYGGYLTFNPKGYAQRKFTCGAALKGIDISNLPSWVTSVGIARTAPAQRVLFQGIGVYDFYYEGDSPKKYTNKLVFFSSDMSEGKGLLSTTDLSFIKNNCKIQLVSPVGYFPDLFNAGGFALYGSGGGSDSVIDLLLNANIIRDHDGSINAPDSTMGINNYVGFGIYRNHQTVLDGTGGNNFNFKEDSVVGNIEGSEGIIDIVNIRHCTSISEKSEWYGRGEWWEIELDKNIYYSTDVAHQYPYDFNEAKQAHEPFYIINIINDSASIPTGESTSYIDTGTFIKIESVMHRVTPNQASEKLIDNLSIQLVDERWEDCYTGDFGSGFFVGKLYEQTVNGDIKVWVDESNIAVGTLNNLKTNIKLYGFAFWSGQGVTIHGFYKQRISGGIYYVDFNSLDVDNKYFKPLESSKILCRYDSSRPIRVFGGDTYVNDSVFAAIDLNKPEGDQYLPFKFPLPYMFYSLPSSLVWADQFFAPDPPPTFYDSSVSKLRQLLIRFISENRFNNAFDYEVFDDVLVSNDRFFPKINYIPRPDPSYTDDEMGDIWTDDVSVSYKTSFPQENTIWRYGGFRFNPVSNSDLLHKLNINIYTKTPTTVTITNKKNKRVLFSRKSSQDSSLGFRSLIQSNYYDLNYDGGEIIAAEQAEDESGGTLYLFTDHGVVILVVDKRLISSVQGDPDNMILSDESTIVTGEYWVSKQVGVDMAMRKSIQSIGSGIIFSNGLDVYLVSGGKIEPIAGTYYDEIRKWIGMTGYSYGSVYDIKNRQYWLSAMHPDLRTKNFVFDLDTKNWVGKYTNSFSKLVSKKDRLIGSGSRVRPGQITTYQLNYPASSTIGLDRIETKLVSAFIPYTEYPASDIIGRDAIKEFRKLRLESQRVPELVKFYKNVDDYEAGISFSQITGADFKNYINFESWISGGKQNPGKSVVIEIIDSEYDDVWIDFMSVQFKKK